jgi:hypothetical protein
MTSDAIAAVGTLVTLLAAAIVAVRTVVIGRASRRWPTVQGRVVSLEVLNIQRRNHGGNSYRPTIKYLYTVHGREYEGRRIRVSNALTMGTETWMQHEARAVLDGYYPGSVAVVYFNPDRPGYSLLQPGVSRLQYLAAAMLVTCGPIIAIAFWFAFFGQGVLSR